MVGSLQPEPVSLLRPHQVGTVLDTIHLRIPEKKGAPEQTGLVDAAAAVAINLDAARREFQSSWPLPRWRFGGRWNSLPVALALRISLGSTLI